MLRKGDIVMVKAQEAIPSDGEVIEGLATVDESARAVAIAVP
jgi:K+-transporting ATPase ATPase B chain